MRNLDLSSVQARAFMLAKFPGATPIPVLRLGREQNGQCYRNVRVRVAKQGGSAVWGWHLKEDEGCFIEAQHHALWRNPKGALIDITDAAADFEPSPFTLFVPDQNSIPHAYDAGIPSIFQQIDSRPTTKQWIKLNVERMNLVAESLNFCLTMNHSFSPDGDLVLHEYPVGRHAKIRRRIEEIDRLIQHL